MSEHDSRLGVPDMVDTRDEPDRDIRFRWVYLIGGALVILTLVYAVLMWPFSFELLQRVESGDPPASPLAEARERSLPPAPRLQADPPQEIRQLHEWEERVLSSYGWVNRARGVARIPVERAMELVLEEGLPEVPNPTTEGE